MDQQYSNDMDDGEGAAEEVHPLDKLRAILQSDNVAESLDAAKLAMIGDDAVSDYRLDRDSMGDWLDRMGRGIELAKLEKSDKNYPFANAANVKYPLITTAALQFNARAYPAIVSSDSVVKVKVHGEDPTGQKAARGERVSSHMSWQLSNKIEEWEEETDKLLVQLPIVGTMVRKVWYDPVLQRPRCRLIAPGAFIVNDRIKALGEAPRISEELSLYPSEIKSRKLTGTFRDIDYIEAEDEDTQKPEDFIEQHCRLDLDGDGYEEPYIVTVHVASRKVARIVPDFEVDTVSVSGDRVISIERESYFVAYHFLPSMDGGFFGTGLGVLLGDISETINSIINMMMDAGHMASLGGGFIGSDFKIKGASQRFKPGEWKKVAERGADIRNSVVPMNFPGPDGTLFQLLGLLIDAGREVASVKDIMTGDTGSKNMTATTTLALIEQGMMVFTASYKRIFRSLKREYKLIAKINAETVSPEEYSAFVDGADMNGQPVMFDPAGDYAAADMDIVPVADPNSVTNMQEAAKAQVVMQLAEGGLVDPQVGAQRVLEAANIPDVEELAIKPNPMQDQMMAMQAKVAEADVMLKMVEVEQALATVEKTRTESMKNMTDAAATKEGVRLDGIASQLEEMRFGLEAAIGHGLGGVAQQPRNRVSQGMPN